MNLWQQIVSELAAHQIEVRDDGLVIIHGHSGPKQLSVKQASAYIRSKSSENSKFLMSLWTGLTRLPNEEGAFPSNDGTRRMFIAALQHLANLSSTSKILVKAGVHRALCALLLRDVASFPNSLMSKVIDYRIAIDWVSHLIAYDQHRADLVEALEFKDQMVAIAIKMAAGGLATNYSYTEAAPWELYRTTLRNDRGSSETALTEDKTHDENQRTLVRFNDPHSPLVGQTFVGQQRGQDSMLPNPDLPTEDPEKGPQGQIAQDVNARPELWTDLSNGAATPGSMRLRTPTR